MQLADLAEGYRAHIVAAHKQPLFLLLLGFISSFVLIRISVRMIRAQVRWWPGNITPGGLHIHHMVFGVGALLVAGTGVFATSGSSPWIDWFGLLFGIGCGLVLDEFALILHLEDVYWSEQGRKSVDAVILGILITGLLLTGYAPLGVVPGQDGAGRWTVVAVISFNALLSVVALLKGKMWTGLLGILVPGLSWIGAVRLARPSSPWARWRYADRPRRRARALRRERRLHARVDLARMWLFDLIAGAPDKVPAHHAVTHRMAEAVAARATAHLDPHRAHHPTPPPAERAADQRRRTVQAGRVRAYRARSGRRRGL
jgi:lysyl-tRNA synthetase class 2